MSLKDPHYYDREAITHSGQIPKATNAGVAVIIDEYDPTTHSVKVRRLKDGLPLGGNIDSTEEITRAKPTDPSGSKVLKTLAAPDAPIIEVNDTIASLRGSPTSGFYSTRQSGNIIKGPTSFEAQPNEIRVSGMMTLHPLLLSGFPSTIVTPIPTLQWSLPTGTMLGPIVKDIALISTLLGIGA